MAGKKKERVVYCVHCGRPRPVRTRSTNDPKTVPYVCSACAALAVRLATEVDRLTDAALAMRRARKGR